MCRDSTGHSTKTARQTQTPVKQPTAPLQQGQSGAHGQRGQVNALAGVPASKHALAECDPVRTFEACLEQLQMLPQGGPV